MNTTEIASRLNEVHADRLGRFHIVAAPAAWLPGRRYAYFLLAPGAGDTEREGAFLAVDPGKARSIILDEDLERIWAKWQQSREDYARTQTPEARLLSEVDQARRTWTNYVQNEVPPARREAMARPTPENVLFRLRQKGLVKDSVTAAKIEAAMGLMVIDVGFASWMWDVPRATITKACRQGYIAGATKDRRDWIFRQEDFLAWYTNPIKPGPKVEETDEGGNG